MDFNVCTTCGARDGRAGMLIGPKDSNISECINCRDTRKTGIITLHANLPRTDEEIARMVETLINGPGVHCTVTAPDYKEVV